MCVEVMFVGRLGNNLFQYALGRIIAEHLRFELICRDFPVPVRYASLVSSDDTPSATFLSVASQFPNAPVRIQGRRYWSPTEDFIVGTRDWKGQALDLNKLLADRTPRQIRLAGFFQQYNFYRPHAERIRRWFAAAPAKDWPSIKDDDVMVNVRGGTDMERLGWLLDPTYYVTAIRSMTRIGTVFVCGVGINSRVREALAPFNPVYVDGTPMDHFRVIQRFRRIVLPNSTFSWWAAFLSSAEEIYVPDPQDASIYSFKTSDVDLEVNDGRYIKVAC